MRHVVNEEIITQVTESAQQALDNQNLDDAIATEEGAETKETKEVEQKEPAKSEDDVPFPKKAINALSRRDKQIGKLRAELQQRDLELQRYQQQQSQKQAPDSDVPNEDSFDNYGDYLKAIARYEAKQELAQGTKQQQEQQRSASQQAWIAERQDYVAVKAQEAIDSVPDFQQVMSENVDIVESFPPHIEHLFLEADNAALAFYALAKEGKLESLLEMSPARAAMEIGRAEDRGVAMTKAKPVTKAPTPISASKGTGTVGKTLDRMSTEELLAFVNKK